MTMIAFAEDDRPLRPRARPAAPIPRGETRPLPLSRWASGDLLPALSANGKTRMAIADRRLARSLIYFGAVTRYGLAHKRAPFGYTGRVFRITDRISPENLFREIAVEMPRAWGGSRRVLFLEGASYYSQGGDSCAVALGQDVLGNTEPDGTVVTPSITWKLGGVYRLGRMCFPRPADVDAEFQEARP